MKEFAIDKWVVRAIAFSNGRLVMHVFNKDGTPHVATGPTPAEDRVIISFDPAEKD